MEPQSLAITGRIAFIGGGNMASAIIGGLLREGTPSEAVTVVEPDAAQRERLESRFRVLTLPEAGPALAGCSAVVWAVKPQTFQAAAQACAPHTRAALHLSVAAGIRSDSMANWLGTERIVRAMPNTPALVGRGMTGLYARPGLDAQDRRQVEQILSFTGEVIWLNQESDLDAVTALSGSGPAYVFYFIEAMREAGMEMGLSADVATRLAIGTFAGAAQLAHGATEPPEVLRERVTSKGGTTYAALTVMEAEQMKARFIRAMHAAQARAVEMGQAFGGPAH